MVMMINMDTKEVTKLDIKTPKKEPMVEVKAEVVSRLEELEGVIQRGFQTFIEVGNALLEIQNSQLYKESHSSFEAYLKERWNLERRRAYQLIDAAEIAADVNQGSQNGKALPAPTSERQIRPLKALPKEQRSEAYTEAVAKNNGEAPTGKQVAESADKRKQPKAIKPKAEPEAKVDPVTPARIEFGENEIRSFTLVQTAYASKESLPEPFQDQDTHRALREFINNFDLLASGCSNKDDLNTLRRFMHHVVNQLCEPNNFKFD